MENFGVYVTIGAFLVLMIGGLGLLGLRQVAGAVAFPLGVGFIAFFLIVMTGTLANVALFWTALALLVLFVAAFFLHFERRFG